MRIDPEIFSPEIGWHAMLGKDIPDQLRPVVNQFKKMPLITPLLLPVDRGEGVS
jgi:hypothetical protein